MGRIARHEAELTAYALKKLKGIPGITIYGSVDEKEVHDRLGVISFNLKNKPHGLVGAILNYEGGIGVRNGCFCAHPYVKCLLGVSIEESHVLEEKVLQHDRRTLPGAVRMSFGMYNTRAEIDRLVDVLHLIAAEKYKGKYKVLAETGEYHPVGFKLNFVKYFRLS
jgi:selenocysteine lyase/cysteine desulfurase